jgi:long-subunit fatty acid transport protein
MRAHSLRLNVLLAFLAVALFTTSSFAQGEPESPFKPEPDTTPTVDFSGLPLDLLPPGARSLGLGGAFSAVADDATSALANPAGLTNLTASEVSIHVRNTDADVEFLDTDAYDSALNNGAGQLYKEYSDSSTDVSFASFVVPFEKFVFSGFYSSQVQYDSIQALEDIVDDTYFLDRYTNVNEIKAEMDSVGLSLAYRITDSWSFGATVQRSKLKMASRDLWQVDWYTDIELALEALSGFETSAEEYLDVVQDTFVYQSNIDDSDADITYSVGLLYNPIESLSFGLVYRRGASFGLDAVGTVDSNFGCDTSAASDLVADCVAFIGNVDESIWFTTESAAINRVKVPDIVTLGIAWRPTNRWLISLDINRIGYADATPPRDVTQGLGLDINWQFQRRFMTDPDIVNLQGPLTEDITDETSFNFGVERDFVFDSGAMQLLTVRAGAYSIKDHDGVVHIDSDDTAFTVGLGTVWGKRGIGESTFQVDLAASFADKANNVILSGIYRF